MAVVSLVKCSCYEQGDVAAALAQSIENLGFSKDFFAGARVAVKPNLLTVAKDESGVITHPEFFRAVLRIIKSGGGRPVLVESPAVHSLARVIKKTGYAKIIADEKIEVADPAPVRTLYYAGARRFKYIDISAAYFDADMIVALPKFKTHGITYITGAVKLLFGAVPGLEKSKMHLRLPGHKDFADFLLDLYEAMTFGFNPSKPIFYIMDAVTAMEGEGPGHGGRPRQMGAVLAGTDAVAVDYVAARVAGLDTGKAPTIVNGFKRGCGASGPQDIEVAGESPENMQVVDFVPAAGDSYFSGSDRWPLNTKTFKDLFVERPVPRADLCTLCYECRKICPAGAIGASAGGKKIPEYDYAKCIRCYCCLEVCPEGAVEKKKGRLQRLFGFFGRSNVMDS